MNEKKPMWLLFFAPICGREYRSKDNYYLCRSLQIE